MMSHIDVESLGVVRSNCSSCILVNYTLVWGLIFKNMLVVTPHLGYLRFSSVTLSLGESVSEICIVKKKTNKQKIAKMA